MRAIDGAGVFTEQTFAIDVLDGEEWVLSSGQDTIPPSDANAQVIGTATTLNSNDILEGGDGRDLLVLFGAGTFNLNNITSFTNFEEVRLVNFVSTGTALTLGRHHYRRYRNGNWDECCQCDEHRGNRHHAGW